MPKENTKPEKKKYSVIINAVVAKDGKILIIQRGWEEKHGPGTWSIPGGKLEYVGMVYEALQKTAKKEVLEESGLEIKDEMYLIANNTFQHNEDNLQVMAIVFLCFYKSGRAKPLEDTADVKWIEAREINNFEFHNINVKNYVLKGFEFLKKIK